jgi:hypothetical protein
MRGTIRSFCPQVLHFLSSVHAGLVYSEGRDSLTYYKLVYVLTSCGYLLYRTLIKARILWRSRNCDEFL